MHAPVLVIPHKDHGLTKLGEYYEDLQIGNGSPEPLPMAYVDPVLTDAPCRLRHDLTRESPVQLKINPPNRPSEKEGYVLPNDSMLYGFGFVDLREEPVVRLQRPNWVLTTPDSNGLY